MKKKLLCLSAICLATGFARAEITQKLHKSEVLEEEYFFQEPTYLNGVTQAAGWGRNWFIDFKGGGNVFLGNPLGCGDLGDRLKPTLQAGLGKWFIPSVGTRVVYQGFRFRDANLLSRRYNNVHADLLYNATSSLNLNEEGLSRWDLIPYLGAGIVFHRINKNRPFALHYGVMARYRLTNSLHAVAEVGGMSTFRNFDGVGDARKLGDNMLNLSVGLNLTIGKAGWKKVVDARPYMEQNRVLAEYAQNLKREISVLEKRLVANEIILKEYEKILEIEGLLQRYRKSGNIEEKKDAAPKNNYSGLNSLRARLAAQKVAEADSTGGVVRLEEGSYMSQVAEGRQYIGAPIYFFFNLGTTVMTDASQKLNLDELAAVAKKHGLYISIEGAADSATGTQEINAKLSQDRAAFIKAELLQRGIKEGHIMQKAKGGVKEYDPKEANRHTKVTLYLK